MGDNTEFKTLGVILDIEHWDNTGFSTLGVILDLKHCV